MYIVLIYRDKLDLVSQLCMCVLPEETYADPAALSESTETKPLFAINVRKHKGEILPNLIVGNPKIDTEKQTHN